MILHLSIFGLLVVLIAVIVLSTREGFDTPATTVTVTKMCKDAAHVCTGTDDDCKDGRNTYINIYGKTSATTAQNVRIVYSSTSNTITGTASSDSLLTETAVASPAPSSSTTPDALITNVNINRLAEGKTYYIIPKTNTTYTAGGTAVPLLGSFTYRAADALACPPASSTPARATAVISFRCKEGSNVRMYGHTTKTTAVQAKIVYSSTANTIAAGGVSDRVLSTSVVFQPRTMLTPTLVAIVSLADLADNKTYYIIGSADATYTNGVTTLLGSFVHQTSELDSCPVPVPVVPRDRDRSRPSSRRDDDGKSEVKMSDTAYDALTAKQRADLLRDVKRIMRDEIRASRRMNPSADRDEDGDGSCDDDGDSDAVQQGREFSQRCRKMAGDDAAEDAEVRCPTYPNGTCPPVPDMSKYIRKDAIPCWGCAIDF